MKLFRNKLFIGLVCILIGVAVAFFAIPAVAGDETSVVDVYVAVQDIGPGVVIEETHLEKVTIPAKLAGTNPLDVKTAVGLKTVTAVFKGDTVTSDKLTENYVPLDTYSPATAKGKMVMSITAGNLPVSVAARIQPGDVVSVLALPVNRNTQPTTGITPPGTEPDVDGDKEEQVIETEEGEVVIEENPTLTPATMAPQTILYPELTNLEVAAVVASAGNNADVKQELGKDEENSLPTTVSFYVTEEQALRLAELERHGNAYIVFVARGENTYDFIPEAEKVLHIDTPKY